MRSFPIFKKVLGYLSGTSIAEGKTLIDITGYDGVTFPAAAAPANGVSMAAVLRKNYDLIVAHDIDIKADIGDFSGQTNLQSLLAVLGVPDVSSKSFYTCLVTDRLDHANYGLSKLKDAIGDLVPESTGTFSYDETSAAEQDMEEVVITTRSKVGGIWLKMSLVTQDTEIRVHHKTDTTNYDKIETHPWKVGDGSGVLIDGFTAYRDIKVTLQCGGGGSGSVNVPYAIV